MESAPARLGYISNSCKDAKKKNWMQTATTHLAGKCYLILRTVKNTFDWTEESTSHRSLQIRSQLLINWIYWNVAAALVHWIEIKMKSINLPLAIQKCYRQLRGTRNFSPVLRCLQWRFVYLYMVYKTQNKSRWLSVNFEWWSAAQRIREFCAPAMDQIRITRRFKSWIHSHSDGCAGTSALMRTLSVSSRNRHRCSVSPAHCRIVPIILHSGAPIVLASARKS